MSLILKYCISKGYFSLGELNSILASWKYGPLDKANKPVPIRPTFVDGIKQNAGRMWCLLRLLPLMVGDKYWQFFLQLKDIVEVVFGCWTCLDAAEQSSGSPAFIHGTVSSQTPETKVTLYASLRKVHVCVWAFAHMLVHEI